eukprot:m.281770 g.281770  ORF g.281770 m.281770 type:complete len:50 (+) comp155532_c0_seq1:275-424(+)
MYQISPKIFSRLSDDYLAIKKNSCNSCLNNIQNINNVNTTNINTSSNIK